MNKALEQKLIGPLEESHTKNNPPKQFCERSFEQGDQKWQQDEQELAFELASDFVGRKKECVVAGISGGDPCGVHEAGGAPRGGALHPRGHVAAPPAVFSMPDILKYSRKNHISFSGHLENFYFRGIFYCKDNSENRQKILFCLI